MSSPDSVASMRIVLPFNCVGRNEFQFEIISALVQHVLYARTMLPMPLNDFRQDVFSLSTAVKITSADRKRIKMLEQIELILSGLLAAVQVFDVTTVAILLGPSANNPKEVHQLQFEFSPNYEETSRMNLTDKHINHAKRNMIHKLIEHQDTEEGAPSSKQNMFIAFQITENNHHSKPSEQDNTVYTQFAEDDMLHQDVFNIFSFRDSFKIRTGTAGSTMRAVGGKKRLKPLHLCLVSKDVQQRSMDATAVAVSAHHIVGAVCGDSMTDGVVQADTAADNVIASESPSDHGAFRWLVQNKGLKGLPGAH